MAKMCLHGFDFFFAVDGTLGKLQEIFQKEWITDLL